MTREGGDIDGAGLQGVRNSQGFWLGWRDRWQTSRGTSVKIQDCVRLLLALGATGAWTEYWLVQSTSWAVRGTVTSWSHLSHWSVAAARPPVLGSLLTCACGRAVGTCDSLPREALCTERELSLCPPRRDFPHPSEPALVPPGALHLDFLSFPSQVSWPTLAQQVLLPLLLLF